ncbi:hypothetical protein DFJ58DRAFT_756744 [Suillus subalutaceus]|uniref:uncharacterized protein n=1 Tax=Suillus subalutaceus TaxID=48586 RepID=UPI001B879753|nr:uncharacterized protein DFJ58DRAFT_756744 [Suillus subalutaceus]KAG1875525.1 hypothetical protein DFJ58DRAFT_756744 [Suillus subalutaceus]
MSALSEASTPAHDAASAMDAQQLHQLHQHAADAQQQQQQQQHNSNGPSPVNDSTATRKAKAPSVRRACTACHTGKTRCSEVLPCQGIGATCAYPDPESDQNQSHQTPGVSTFAQAPLGYVHGAPTLSQHQYYDYNGALLAPLHLPFGLTSGPRNLTEEEAAAITRNFSRGDFFVGSSAPVRIDPRLPVRLTLGEGDHVHFSITETLT